MEGNNRIVLEPRETLATRLGFILLSAGCAIGCGNVWKFPWMCGQYGGGAFVFIYLIFLIVLGLPIMTMEFSLGRASKASPVKLYQKLEKPGQKWHIHGYASLAGNVLLMMFYTSVSGWILYYFYKFVSGGFEAFTPDTTPQVFDSMLSNPAIMIGFMAIVVVLGFLILSFGLQHGVEFISKYMMIILFVLLVVLVVRSFTLEGATAGLEFYLKPDVSKITGNVVVGAMNQAFFTLSLGIGSMAIFGSYIDKRRSLLGESLNVIVLDTAVAIMAGLIIFPACFTYSVEPGAGPGLLFVAMAKVFNSMSGGRWWGSAFFLFMFFAAMSTVLAVFENILACVRELTGLKRTTASILCGIGMLILSVPCALGFNLWSGFHPFNSGSGVLDLEDFLVSYCLLPIGSLCYIFFCTSKKHGWGFDNFMAEANTGKGLKVKRWMYPYIKFVLPVIILVVFVMGIITFEFKDGFTILSSIQKLF